MITFIAGIVGQRAARPVFFGLIALVVLITMFTVSRCSRDDTAQRQAEQTTRSGDAIANAAQDAIGTITNRAVTEADVDQATAQAMENIDNAQDPVAVRDAVLNGVCGQASHRNDPACKVR